MNYFYKYASLLIDNAHRRFTNKKHAAENIINKKGLDESDLNKVWAILDQVHLGHHCKAKHTKQFISLYDQVVPLKFQQLLWEIYDKPEKYEMHFAHTTSFFYFSKIACEIARFVESKKSKSLLGVYHQA